METRSTLIEGPSVEPLAVPEVKTDRVITHDLHDTLFVQYIQAAREMAEMRTGRALLPQTWQQLNTNAGVEIPLERWPAIDIVSISINGETVDHAALIENGDIEFYPGDDPLIVSSRFRGARVIVQYRAGYADQTAVPASIKKWMLLQIGSMYEHRESEVIATVTQRVRYADGLLAPHIIRRFW